VTALAAPRALPVLGPDLRGPAPFRDLCTDCGVSRTSAPERCGQVCQFIHPQYPALEQRAHGRARDEAREDEALFGPYLEMSRARLRAPRPGAQWTGITTRIGERLLEAGLVDAVIATAADPDDRWRPRPVLVRTAAGMQACRGMKMGYSPVLALLDQAAREGLTRLAVIGVPCQVHALRALEPTLGLLRLYVIGTPCSDNTTTEHFHDFLARVSAAPDRVTYCEFQPDLHLELRYDDRPTERIPFLQLPIADLPADFFPLTCRSCFDYANALADVTVGYMAGEGDQWLVVRNARGRELATLLGGELETRPLGTAGRRGAGVRGYLANLMLAANGLPVRRAPRWLRPLLAWVMPRFGPRGLEFARARVEMKLLEGITTLRRHRPRRVARLVPAFAWRVARRYGLVVEPN
jgi:coenzyme F420 hydrogenase subunit beta